MSQIRGKDTKPEMQVRRWLWHNGYRYRLHRKGLPGKPDIVFPGRKKVIFVHGCFWHKHDCRYFKWPATNPSFWKEKIMGTVARDRAQYAALQDMGWSYLVVWECELKASDTSPLYQRLRCFLEDG